MPKWYIDFECWVSKGKTEDEALKKAEAMLKIRKPHIVSTDVVEDEDIVEFFGEEA